MLNILLTEFSNPYSSDHLLPSGRLREWRFGAGRADVVIVTKCPENLTEADFEKWRNKLQLKKHQHLFFSKISYGDPYNIFQEKELFKLNPGLHITLISAIAQSSYLMNYLSSQVASVVDINFEDHHYFKEIELNDLIAKHQAISHANKMILTTEKDATRLILFKELFEKNEIDVYAIPIKISFYHEERFNSFIKNFLLDFKI